jgi:hypothetical protein
MVLKVLTLSRENSNIKSMKVDFVVTYLEVQVETADNPFGSYATLTFIDTYPNFPKVDKTVKYFRDQIDVSLLKYDYTFHQIRKDTDLTQYEITRH